MAIKHEISNCFLRQSTCNVDLCGYYLVMVSSCVVFLTNFN